MVKKITSAKELKKLRERFSSETELRAGIKEIRITVHMGTCGIAAGARDIMNELITMLTDANVTNVSIQQSGCLGLCDKEPMLTITDVSGKKVSYGNLDRKKIDRIVLEHVVGGMPVAEYILEA